MSKLRQGGYVAMENTKTLGEIGRAAYEAKWRELRGFPPAEVQLPALGSATYQADEVCAAAIVAAHEAAQLMTWDEAMAWSLGQCNEHTPPRGPGWVLAYSSGLGRWYIVRAGREHFDAGCFVTGSNGLRFVPPNKAGERAALTHFRRLPAQPKEARTP